MAGLSRIAALLPLINTVPINEICLELSGRASLALILCGAEKDIIFVRFSSPEDLDWVGVFAVIVFLGQD